MSSKNSSPKKPLDANILIKNKLMKKMTKGVKKTYKDTKLNDTSI
jgi:hypothetical protein